MILILNTKNKTLFNKITKMAKHNNYLLEDIPFKKSLTKMNLPMIWILISNKENALKSKKKNNTLNKMGIVIIKNWGY
jgi:hypothetical protein